MIAPDPPVAADDPGPSPRCGRRGGAAVMGLNLTPMIDVVFQLLIYFMAATEFRLGEEIYRTDLPQRSSSSDPFDLPRDPLRIGGFLRDVGFLRLDTCRHVAQLLARGLFAPPCRCGAISQFGLLFGKL